MRIKMKFLLKAGLLLLICVLAFILFSVFSFLFFENQNKSFLYPVVYTIIAFTIGYVSTRFVPVKPIVFVIIIGSVSFCAALVVALKAHTEPISDFLNLYKLSELLKNGKLDIMHNSEYFLRWAYQSFFVIYQAFIMTLFPWGITPLLVFNALFIAGTVIFIYLIAKNIFQEKTARFITVIFFLYPSKYFLASVLTNQHISLFFLLLGSYIILRNLTIKNGILGGFIIAIGNAFRMDGMLVIVSIILLAIIIFISQKEKLANKMKTITPLAISAVCCFLTGFLISSIVMLSGVNPNGQKNMYPLWIFVVGLNAETKGGYSAEIAEEALSSADISSNRKAQIEIVRRHLSVKGGLFSQLTEKSWIFWGRNEETNWAFRGQDERNIPIVNKTLGSVLKHAKQVERVYFSIILLFALSSLVLVFISKNDLNPMLIFCGLVFLMFFIVYIFIECQPRYRYFSYPFLFILAGSAIEQIYDKGVIWSRFSRRK